MRTSSGRSPRATSLTIARSKACAWRSKASTKCLRLKDNPWPAHVKFAAASGASGISARSPRQWRRWPHPKCAAPSNRCWPHGRMRRSPGKCLMHLARLQGEALQATPAPPATPGAQHRPPAHHGDRGLAGAYNGNIIRASARQIYQWQNHENKQVSVVTVGPQGAGLDAAAWAAPPRRVHRARPADQQRRNPGGPRVDRRLHRRASTTRSTWPTRSFITPCARNR